jgi:hypothetical protein
MKKNVILFILLIFVSSLIYADSEITFKSTILDFGEIDKGKMVNLSFEFKNTGDSLLIIKYVKSTCGCTVAHINKKEYKPGETGTIPVIFNSRGFKGKIIKTITAITNSKTDNGYTRLKITGMVKMGEIAKCTVFPNKLLLKDVFMGEPQTRKISIKNTGTLPLKLYEFMHSPELILSVNKSVILPKESAELSITITPFKIGNHSSFIKIRTNQYPKTDTYISFKAFVKNKK